MGFGETDGIHKDGQSFERQWPRRRPGDWPLSCGLPEGIFLSGEATVLVLSACAEDSQFLGALLGAKMPLFAYPFPVVVTAGEDSGAAKLYWKASDLPEIVSEEALQAESEQLMYCYSGRESLDPESRRHLEEIHFIQIERERSLLRRGLRLIFLMGGSVDTYQQFQSIYPWVDATVFVGSKTGCFSDLDRCFYSINLHGSRKTDIFFAADLEGELAPDEQGDLARRLRRLLGPVFAGKDGVVDEALYEKRVFRIDTHAAPHARTESGSAPERASKPDASGIRAFEGALCEHLGSVHPKFAGAAGLASACPGAR